MKNKYSNNLCIILLSHNSANNIKILLKQLRKINGEIFVIDSGSSDGTLDIIKSLNIKYIKRSFKNYGDQRNWTIKKFNYFKWQLHIDSDEFPDKCLIKSINEKVSDYTNEHAFLVKREDYFMGKKLKFSGINQLHLRLFRSNDAFCESSLYDQHFVSTHKAIKLKGALHDFSEINQNEWIKKHLRWAELEANSIITNQQRELGAELFNSSRERARLFKNFYYKTPTGYRAFIYFLYRYFLKLGFLDGKEGFYFCALQAFWFRVFIDFRLDNYNFKGFNYKNELKKILK